MLCSSSHASTMLPRRGSSIESVDGSTATASTLPPSSSPTTCSGELRSVSPSLQTMSNGSRNHRSSAIGSSVLIDTQSSHSGHHPSNSTSAIMTSTSSRPRHHARSFSTERRFDGGSSSSTNGAAESAHMMQLPVRNKRSPSLESGSHVVGEFATSLQRNTSSAHTSSPTASSSSSSTNRQQSATASSSRGQDTSPPRLATSSVPTPHTSADSTLTEEEKLLKLRSAQANRRPRVMRMTPAYSSLPGRVDISPTPASPLSNVASTTTNSSDATEDNSITFPAKSVDQLQSTGRALAGKKGTDPGAGLQIDLACIPSPSLQDLEGPVSTSKLDNLARDRNGNPIKSSLKTPRSSVSHFMPGRTSRSDSTPAMPTMHFSKSVPNTPTVPKNVHFDSQLEHVKVFKFKQKPTAVSRDGSPEQTETETEEEKDMFPFIWKQRNSTSPTNDGSPTSPVRSKTSPAPVEEQLVLRLPNFPSSTRLSVDREVFLERIFLAEDLRSVKGTVQVRNISFEKWVAVRYTLDHWATIGEVSAEHSESIKGGEADRFTFSIKLNELLNWPRGSGAHETKSMSLCLRYTVSQGDFWDNNDGANYQLDFRRRPMPSTPASTPTALQQPRATVPDSVASTATRARVLEMARRGVGGKGVFAMEDLRRELEKLRSDDEEEVVRRADVLSLHDAHRRRTTASPPGSPGRHTSQGTAPPHGHGQHHHSNSTGSSNARSSSPSVWTARYDFGQSLRNPRSGSRKTGEGRAAALDYFSAKPMGSPTSSSHGLASAGAAGSSSLPSTVTPTPPSFTVSAASPPNKPQAELHYTPAASFKARFGMMSPGLGDDGLVEHLPVTSRNSMSPSPSATPTLSMFPLPVAGQTSATTSPTMSPHATPMSSQNSADRFHTYPLSRHTISPGATTPTGSGHASPVHLSPGGGLNHRSSMEILRATHNSSPLKAVHLPTQSNSRSDALSRHDKETSFGSTASSSTEESIQSSPRSSPPSDGGSPNPFSPSVSVSSMDSDTTVSMLPTSMASPPIHSKLATLSIDRTPSMRSLGAVAGDAASNSTLSLQSAVSLQSSSSAGDDVESHDRLRPASMSDYQELVNRFCWNQDVVPSGGSMVPLMPVNGGLGKPNSMIDGQPTTHASPPLISGKRYAASIPLPLNDSTESSTSSGASTPTRHA